jgi:hypothetical protein
MSTRGIGLEYLFLVVALTWGVAQVFIVPPLQVPDEGDHRYRAWAITDGRFTADRNGMITLPGSFAPMIDLYTDRVVGEKGWPPLLEGLPGFRGYRDLFNGPGIPGTVTVASRVANYGPVGYLPQALGVGLGRLFGTSPLACFYLARLANLFAAVALLFFAIRIAPFGKQLFLLLSLLPMTMFMLASVSCDAMTIAGAMFFTALVLGASTRGTLRRVDIAVVLSSAAVFLNVKPGYWALVMLVLLIRSPQLGSRRRYVAFVAASIIVVASVALLLWVLTSNDARAVAIGDPHSRLWQMLQSPLEFLGILGSNLPVNLAHGLIQTVGVLGWLNVALPPAFYAFVLAVALAFFLLLGEEVRLQPWQRVLLAAVGIAVFLTIMVALYAFLKPPADVGVNGRYLVPVWLLLMLSVYGTRTLPRRRGVPFIVGVLVVMMAVNLQTLMAVYHP